MRSVSQDNITEVFLNYCSENTDDRFKFLLERLVSHLHEFAKDVTLTHEEWRRAIQFLVDAGRISTPERNEFILLSDVLGLSSLVDMINSSPHGQLPRGGDAVKRTRAVPYPWCAACRGRW